MWETICDAVASSSGINLCPKFLECPHSHSSISGMLVWDFGYDLPRIPPPPRENEERVVRFEPLPPPREVQGARMWRLISVSPSDTILFFLLCHFHILETDEIDEMVLHKWCFGLEGWLRARSSSTEVRRFMVKQPVKVIWLIWYKVIQFEKYLFFRCYLVNTRQNKYIFKWANYSKSEDNWGLMKIIPFIKKYYGNVTLWFIWSTKSHQIIYETLQDNCWEIFH